MSQESPDVDAVFCAAVEIESADERAAYVERACAERPELRSRLEKLLDAHFRAGSFLESPAAELDPTATPPEISERPGAVIGRYKLMERIGEGGMGVVYVAKQREPVRRKVALKIIKPGMDTKEVIARFEAERQALALMDHPNIARVLDAGATESGRPYFVMELVRGIPITDYCDQNHLTPRQRLELFLSVCQAVQHAHQKGVIHRDVKPTNVLVTLHDGKPVPKIIDFGVAKAINQQLTERTVYTRHMQMIGTPLYMSPEQAELSGLDVDTRTDIYSLGVLLYELLTGTTPFDKERLREAAYDEVRRIIREEEPPKPSTRISTLGEPATAISADRKSDPRRLSQLIRGDLDWIVMKALEKDRTRRYETASSFARDVQRHLSDEPVQARAPSKLYRLRKFVRRNRVAVITTTVITLVLALGAAGIGWERWKGRVNRLQVEARVCVREGRLGDTVRIIEKLHSLGHREDPETLATMHELSLAYANVDRLEDAAQVLLETHAIQCDVLGEDHADTLLSAETREKLTRRCADKLAELFMNPNASLQQYRRALALLKIAKQLEPSFHHYWFCLAICQYRCEDWEESARSLQKSIDSAESQLGWEWIVRAMIAWKLDDPQLAHDAYTAGVEMLRRHELNAYFWGKDGDAFRLALTMRDEAESLLCLEAGYPPVNRPPSEFVEAYSRLIQTHPRVADFYRLRGLHRACLGDWKEAAADCARAAELEPDVDRNWGAWAAICVYSGDLEGHRAFCRKAKEWHDDHGRYPARMGRFVDACLSSAYTVDPAEVRQLEEDAIEEGALRTSGMRVYFRLGRGIALYRSGQFAEAANMLPKEGLANGKDQLLGKLFRAMAQHQLGNNSAAVVLLEEARARLDKELPEPAGPPIYHGMERPWAWCMFRSLLREAEALIEAQEQQSESAGAGDDRTSR